VSRLIAVGADGARGGWAVACLYAFGTRLRLARTVDEIARIRAGNGAPVAIDIPIGLPEADGCRPCDADARRLLGRRASTVFTAPARYLLAAAGDYAAMRALVAGERLRNPAARGVSAQAAGIAGRIREVDDWVRADPDSEQWLFECHPELCFLALDGGASLQPKRSRAGARRRLELVVGEFPDAEARIAAAPAPRGRASVADWLDAYATLTAARAITRREYTTLGGGARDAHGLPMRILHPRVREEAGAANTCMSAARPRVRREMRAEGLEPPRLAATRT
jgi:predicted RNase H-like nuclease